MNRDTVRDVLLNVPVQVLFQVAAHTAQHSKSHAINELARQLGCKPAVLWNYLRARRQNRVRRLRCLVINQPDGQYSSGHRWCDHKYLFGDGFRICVLCGENNFPDHPCWRSRAWNAPEPKPEPSKVYRVGQLRGGRG